MFMSQQPARRLSGDDDDDGGGGGGDYDDYGAASDGGVDGGVARRGGGGSTGDAGSVVFGGVPHRVAQQRYREVQPVLQPRAHDVGYSMQQRDGGQARPRDVDPDVVSVGGASGGSDARGGGHAGGAGSGQGSRAGSGTCNDVQCLVGLSDAAGVWCLCVAGCLARAP